MARGSYEIRRARREHPCTEAWGCRIGVGSFYLYGASPPERDWNSTGRWYVTKACLRHAETGGLHTNETRAAVERLKGGEPDQ